MKKKKKVKYNRATMKCPYCGGGVTFRSADGIYKDNLNGTMLYVCKNYPACDAYVRVKAGTTEPLGTMADGKLRTLRIKAHQYFDLLHKTGIMTKEEAYQWLAYIISAPLSQAHIGYLGAYYCQVVIDESKKRLYSSKRKFYKGVG